MTEEDGIFWKLSEGKCHLEFEFRDGSGDVEVRGVHKWDGCVDWETSETCMAHFCGLDDATALLTKFRTVARIARREIVNYYKPSYWPEQ